MPDVNLLHQELDLLTTPACMLNKAILDESFHVSVLQIVAGDPQPSRGSKWLKWGLKKGPKEASTEEREVSKDVTKAKGAMTARIQQK